MDIVKKIAAELEIRPQQVEAVIKLIDEGNTIPFIARYRKEAHGSLNDEQLRNLSERLTYLRTLEEKKEQVLATIEEQGKLTDELKAQILAAETQVLVEDLYRPYRPKRRTRAIIAKEKGLEPLAQIILAQEVTEPLETIAEQYVSEEKEVKDVADAIAGVEKAASGSILLNGVDITNYSIRKRTLEGISYIPEDRQSCGLVMDFTLEENLGLKNYFREPFSHKGVLDKAEFSQYGNELIDRYDIRSSQGNKTIVRSMSGGNQQKAIIAREVEQDSSLMIFVQPTRGLDIGAIENIHKQIIAERDKGKAILLISLELDEIMNCADTIAVIYNGSIQKIAKASELTTNEVGEFMMGVKNKEKEA